MTQLFELSRRLSIVQSLISLDREREGFIFFGAGFIAMEHSGRMIRRSHRDDTKAHMLRVSHNGSSS